MIYNYYFLIFSAKDADTKIRGFLDEKQKIIKCI
jgi:hypothetical protein